VNVKILFEDDDLIIIDKASGIVVNRAETQKGETIEDWAAEKVAGVERSGIVHRLDKDTSGLLVIAKTTEVWEKLKAQFKNREVVKKYLALVHGKLYPKMATVNAPIDRNPFNRMHYGVFPGGREAVTDYKVLKEFKEFSFVELTPHTGRTHQLRVHLKYINHPIVSDPIYGGRKNYQNDLKFCPRLFLHATYLKIDNLEFNSPLPAELQTVLDQLQ
jgi:23S rRNA pseudouridine1911/1915/1917 synthase